MKRYQIIVVCLLCTTVGWTQSPWNIDFRPSLSFPTSKFEGNELRPGFGADLKVMYRVMPHLKMVGGWGFQSFDSKESEDTTGQTEIRESAFVFGFELRLPVSDNSLQYFLYAGGLTGQIALENLAINLDTRSDYDIGWEVGVGIQYYVDSNWSFKPQLRYKELPGTFTVAGSSFSSALNYLSVSISISYRI